MIFTILQVDAQAILIQEPSSISVIELAIKGGWLMIPLLFLSIVALYIIGERWHTLRVASKQDEHFMENIRDFITDRKLASAIHLCQTQASPVARLIEKGLEQIDRPIADIHVSIENIGNLEIARLERSLPMLATIAGGAPMVGFLGTVVGMVQAFFNMAQAGNNVDITLLSGGIYTALVTTVAGLIVGITAYFGYNYLTARIGTIMRVMERNIIDFIDMIRIAKEK
jgi:biopolymer transport protein ExbB